MSQNTGEVQPAGDQGPKVVASLERRCAELKARHERSVERRDLVTAQIIRLESERAALDREIAGIEGHGAEAEQWLSYIRSLMQ